MPSLISRPLPTWGEGPGTHRLRMHIFVPKIWVHCKTRSKLLRNVRWSQNISLLCHDIMLTGKLLNMEQGFDSSVVYALSCLRCGDLQLKSKQREAIKSIYEGRDVFVWLPTGYGKSICFHSLPFLFDFKLGRVSLPPNKHSVCLVMSPLLSLMVDQVSSLRGLVLKQLF